MTDNIFSYFTSKITGEKNKKLNQLLAFHVLFGSDAIFFTDTVSPIGSM